MVSNRSMTNGTTSKNGSNLDQSKDGNTMCTRTHTHLLSSSLLSEVQPPPQQYLKPSFGFDEQEKETNDAEDKRDIRYNCTRNGVRGNQTHKSPDALLAFELNQLSLKERGKLENDIHGVQPDSVKETPELLRGSLEQLAIELDSIPEKEKNRVRVQPENISKHHLCQHG